MNDYFTIPTYVNRQLTLERGDGVWLFDESNQPYLDLMSNYGVNILGYHQPKIQAALTEQIQLLTTLHGSFTNPIRAQASAALVERCGAGYNQVFWSNSGAEAIEAALKFAVLTTGKRKFIVCDHGYHGKTLGALSATAGEKYKKPFEPLLWDFVEIPFNDTAALVAAIDDQTAGFIVEPIQGEGGIYVPDPNYLQQVRTICNQRGILLVIDEIQTGMGRTGTLLASENVAADIVCLGKGLGGGIPVGATVVTERVAAAVPKQMHTSTFGGNPLACAGVVVTLQLLGETRLQQVRDLGVYFLQQLAALRSPDIIEARGLGLMLGLAVNANRNKIMQQLQAEHILVIPAGDNVIRFLPPLILEQAQIDLAITTLQRVLDHLS